MVCEVDSEGRCKRHPFVQIQRRGRSGEWKALLDACPLCIIDDNKSVGSGGSRSKGSSAAGNGGIVNLTADHGAMVPLSRENSNQWGLDNLPLEATPSHSSRVTVKFAPEDGGDDGNPDGVSMDPSSPDFYGNQPLRLPVHHDNHRRSYYQEDDDSQSNNPHGNDPHFSSGVSLASSTATGRYSTTGASIVSSSSNANNSVYSSKSARSAPGLQTQMRASALKSLPKYRACPQKMQQYAHVSGSVTTMSMDLDIDDDDSTEEGGGQDNRTMNSDASGSNSNSISNSTNSNSNSKSRELKGRDSKEGKDRTLHRKSSGDRQQQKPSRRDRHGNGGKAQNHPSRPDPEEYLGHDHQHSNHHSSRHNDSNGSNNYFQPPPPPASGPGQRFTIVSPSSRVDDDEVSAISFQSGLSQLHTNPMGHGGYGNNNAPNNSGNGGGHNDMHHPLPGGYSSHHNNNNINHHNHLYGSRMNSALHHELKNFEMVPENDTLLSPAQPNHPPAASTLPFPIRDNRHGNNNHNNHHGNNNYNFQDPQDEDDEEDLTSALPAINTNNYDSKGRCVAHPHIRLRKKKLLGRGWKVLMNACPDCCVEELRRIKLVESARRRKDRAELRQSLQAAASAQAMMAAASAGQGGLHHGYGDPQGLSSSMNAGPAGGGTEFGALASDSDDRNRHNNHPLRNSIQSGPVGGGMGRASTGVGTRRISNNSGNSKNTNGSSPAVAPPPTKSTSFHSATPTKSTSFHSVSNSNTSNNTPTSRGLPPPPPPPPPPQKQSNHKSSDETASLTNSSSGSSRDHNLSFASIHSNPAKQGIGSSSQDTNNNNNNITIKPSASGAVVPKSSSNKDAVNNYGSSTGISNGIQVKSMQWTDDKGNKGVYTGPVNSHFIPHGKGGKMEYDGGKVKEGEWKNGSLRRSSSHHRHHHHHRSSSTAPGDAGGNASGKSSSRRDKEPTASSSSSSNKHGDERRSERKSSERRSTSAMRSSSRVKERGDGNFRSSGVGKSTSFVRSDKGSQ